MNSNLINFILKTIASSSKYMYRDYYELEMQQSSRVISQDFIKRSYDKCQERLAEDLPEYTEKLKFEIIPIEGKDNFAHAIPFFAIVVVAYKEANQEVPDAAVIDFPALGFSYFAENGDSAWVVDHKSEMHNASRRLKCSKRESGLLYITEDKSKAPAGAEIRDFGSIAYSICMVASGKVDGASFKNVHPTLIKAAKLFMQESGGKIKVEDKDLEIRNLSI